MKKEVVKVAFTEDRATLIDQLAKAMYYGDFNVTMGGEHWEDIPKEDKAGYNFPYTKASKYVHRAQLVVEFLEEKTGE